MTITPAEVRKDRIFELLQQEGLTTQEIADKLEMNYHTVFKSCRELQEAGLIHYTGLVRGKSQVWAAGSQGVMPEFYDPAANKKYRADDIVAAYSVQRSAASVKAANAFFETLEQLLNIAQALSQGEKIEERVLGQLRHQVIVNASLVKNLNGYYEQLLKNKDFWSVDGLSKIGGFVKSVPSA